MEEFSKSLITIHRTLMLATIAILAFALSDDPAGEYRDALRAVETVSQLDTSKVVTDVASRYGEQKVFSKDWIKEPNTNSIDPGSFERCLLNDQVDVSTTLAVVVVPEPKTATVETILGYLSEGEVYLAQASTQAIAKVLSTKKFDCDGALKAGLKAVRIGSMDIAVRPVANVRREVRSLSSLELIKYTSMMRPHLSREEYAFTLMTALAKTTTVELEYHKDDTIKIEDIIPATPFASPARDSIKEPFAIYLPNSDISQSTVLGALRRNLGLFGDLNTARAIELLRTKIEEKAKYPTVYGVEIRSMHAVWGLPVLLLALACFLLVHIQAYRREHTHRDNRHIWLPNVLLIPGVGSSIVRVLSLLVLPPMSSLFLVQRLTNSPTWEAWAAYCVCLLLAVVGPMTLLELHWLRDVQTAPKTSS